MKRLLAAVGLAASIGAPAPAAIYIAVADVGPNVVFSFAGSPDLTGMTKFTADNAGSLIFPSQGAMLFAGPIGMDAYALPSFSGFGPSTATLGTATGDPFNIFSSATAFAAGYAGATISGDLTVAGSAAAPLLLGALGLLGMVRRKRG